MNTAATQSFFTDWWNKTLEGFAQGEALSAPPMVVALIVLGAVALSIPKVTWRYFGLFVTVVHELGHAFAGLMTGRVITGIKLNKDQSGTTHSIGRPGLGAVWSGFWGYPAPAVVGAALVWAAINGWSSAALSAGTIVLVLTLLFIRNFYGVLIMLGCAAASWVLAWYAPGVLLGYITLSLGIALLVGGIRDWLNVVSVHFVRRNELASSDAYILFRQTMVPSPVWLLGFGGVVVYAALFAATEFIKLT
jgi:hypothetical protein